jgi:hypothetical protein
MDSSLPFRLEPTARVRDAESEQIAGRRRPRKPKHQETAPTVADEAVRSDNEAGNLPEEKAHEIDELA